MNLSAAFLYLIYLLALLVLWRFAFWFPRAIPGLSRKPTLLVGHRGVRGEKPENTLEAFDFALTSGLDGIECDVQKTQDGVLILYHDLDMKGQRVAGLTLAQVQALGEPIGFLDDLLELAKRFEGTLFNIEIKSETLRSDGVERDTLKRVKEEGLLDRVLFSSFNPMSLLRLRLLDSRARIGYLYSRDMPQVYGYRFLAPWLHVDALHPDANELTEAFIQSSQQKGLNVNTWTVNDPMRISSLCKSGVNAIMGDSPKVMLAAKELKS